jgi:hypothetical protein
MEIKLRIFLPETERENDRITKEKKHTHNVQLHNINLQAFVVRLCNLECLSF